MKAVFESEGLVNAELKKPGHEATRIKSCRRFPETAWCFRVRPASGLLFSRKRKMNEPSEKIDYVARAKALMRGAIRTGALVIIPLAIAAGAKASIILPTTSGSCVTWESQSGSSCNSAVSQLASSGGLEGDGILGGGTYRGLTSGGGWGLAWMTFGVSGPLQLDGTGSTCAGVGDTCDLSPFLLTYSATVTSARASLTPDYDVSFTLDGVTLISVSNGLTSLSDNTDGTLSGSAVIALPAEFLAKVSALEAGQSGGNFTLGLTLSQGWDNAVGGYQTNSSSASVQFSQVSLDLTSVPEPGSVSLAFGGLLGLAAWFRGRKRW